MEGIGLHLAICRTLMNHPSKVEPPGMNVTSESPTVSSAMYHFCCVITKGWVSNISHPLTKWMNWLIDWLIPQNLMSKVADFVMGDNEIPQIDTHWFAESGVIDVFILFGPTAKDIFQQYGSLTGTTPLPPVSLRGPHWCWNRQIHCSDVQVVVILLSN